jgi:hypothetical protein
MVQIMVGEDPYALPALDTLDIDETIVFYDYTGMTFDQAFEIEGLNPKVIKALLHIAVQRKNPDLRNKDVGEMVGLVNIMGVLEQLATAVEEEPNPTKDGVQPAGGDSKRNSDESTDSSGANGNDASEPSPEKLTPVSTGHQGWPTATDSDPTTSAA